MPCYFFVNGLKCDRGNNCPDGHYQPGGGRLLPVRHQDPRRDAVHREAAMNVLGDALEGHLNDNSGMNQADLNASDPFSHGSLFTRFFGFFRSGFSVCKIPLIVLFFLAACPFLLIFLVVTSIFWIPLTVTLILLYFAGFRN